MADETNPVSEIPEEELKAEEFFEEGRSIGEQEGREDAYDEIADRLVGEGFATPDEVEQLLYAGDETDIYDPGRRRRRTRRVRRPRRRTVRRVYRRPRLYRLRRLFDPDPDLVYDPDPDLLYDPGRRRYIYRRIRRRKEVIPSSLGFIAGLAGTVISKFSKRAKDLKEQGASVNDKPVENWIDAIRYDLRNRPESSAMDRLKDHAMDIIVPAGAGLALNHITKKISLPQPRYTKAVLRTISLGLLGAGAGQAINAAITENPGILSGQGTFVQQGRLGIARALAQRTYGVQPKVIDVTSTSASTSAPVSTSTGANPTGGF